jgi:hypothetical protein
MLLFAPSNDRQNPKTIYRSDMLTSSPVFKKAEEKTFLIKHGISRNIFDSKR